MIRDLFYLAVYLITEMILYSIAYCTVFNKKITRNYVKWIACIIAVVLIHIAIYVNTNLEYAMGITMITMAVIPLLLIEPFGIQNILLYPFIIISGSIFGIMFAFLMSVIIGRPEQYIVDSPGLTIFCQILCIVVWGLVYCAKRSKSHTEEITLGWKQYLTLYAVSVSALLIISSVQYFSRLKGYDNVQMYSVYVVMACGTLVVVTLMQIVVLSQNASIKKANDMYKDYIRLQKQHYEHMLLQYDELRKFRHDVKNHMIVLNSMCTSEDSTHMKEYLSQITHEVSNKTPVEYTGNRELDAVISPFIMEAESKNINVKFKGKVPDAVTIDIFDMCTIMSNLLNNAIEACEKIEEDKRTIEVEAANYNTQMFIEVRNSYDNSLVMYKDRIITTKADKKNHGIGLENISRVVKKYDGKMTITPDKEWFIVTISL